MKSLTTAEMRLLNQGKTYELIYRERQISRGDIAARLNLSLPTVGQNLKELEDAGLIRREGVFQSSGGRKPQIISCVGDARIGVGVELSRKEVSIVAVDLFGHVVARKHAGLAYENTERYYRKFGDRIASFCTGLDAAEDDILGVGIAIQGLPSQDGTIVMYGKILLDTGMTLENFSRHIARPSRMIHDAEAAAHAELWFSEGISNAIYMSLSQYLGGILILDRTVHKSPDMNSGLIEHMTLYPGGEPCYCGRRGCFSAYCSANTLADNAATLDEFFTALRAGDAPEVKRWRTYLNNLALGIGNMRMVVPCDVILGGHMSPYIIDEDIDYLAKRLRYNAEGGAGAFYVKRGHSDRDTVACGAALPFVTGFLRTMRTGSRP